MKPWILFASFLILTSELQSQDTFSIVAADSITREVGSAGASCVDLIAFGITDASFLGQLFPDKGAINTQAAYIPGNQQIAAGRMNTSDSPKEIAEWLEANDFEGNPDIRQYGIVKFIGTSPQSSAFTGQKCIDYKNHITGSIDGIAYSIQGNILIGQEILDAMETRFRNAKGTVACRMMEAMQGANSVGADIRCEPNGTSSLFAFIKVAKPTDKADKPYLSLSVVTSNGERLEPIDELQRLFNQSFACENTQVQEEENHITFYPNPSNGILTFSIPQQDIVILDVKGNSLFTMKGPTQFINCSGLPNGSYRLITSTFSGKIIIQH
ncbi:MAG: DUF1028 domain-containing protein [Candidatus Kapaibacteriota bacterium]